MADRVIIVGTKRGPELVSAVELKQMAGRAGRRHDGSVGYVEVIAKGFAEQERMEAIFSGDADFSIDSRMDSPFEASFHLMAEIVNGIVQTREDIRGWFSQSFARYFGRNLDVDEVVHLMKGWGVIVEDGEHLRATALGRISSQHYFHPADIAAWQNNFGEIFSRGLETQDAPLVWALSDVPREAEHACVNSWKKRWLLETLENDISAYRLGIQYGNVQAAALWARLLGGPFVGAVTAEIERMRQDYGRLHNVLVMLNNNNGWEQQDFLDELRIRVIYGVPRELVPLCQLPGIGKTYALDLYNRGVRSVADLRWVLGELEFNFEGTSYLEAVKRLIDEIS